EFARHGWRAGVAFPFADEYFGVLGKAGRGDAEKNRRANPSFHGRPPRTGRELRAQILGTSFSLPYFGSSLPDCSATMYAAYQSDQFASRTPVSFSCSPWAASARRIAFAKSLAVANVVAAESMRPARRVVIS